MSINQDIRYAQPSTDEENPNSLFDFIKPPRWIFNTTDPLPNTGEDQWFFTNITTGDFFIKTFGTWTLYYNFQTGTPSPGITNIQNDGVVGWFKNIIGSTAHFKGISSLSGKITFSQLTNDVDVSVNLNSSDVQLGNVQNIKSNFFGTVPPTALNDSSEGYSVGSFWLNRGVNPSVLYIAESANLAAASWVLLSGSGSGITTIVNLPGSAGVFRDIVGTTANFKALNSTTGKLTFVNNASSVDFGVNLNKNDVGLPLLINTKYVTNSAVNPTVNDDASQNFQLGNIWSNYANGNVYQNRGNIVGAAVWAQIAGVFVRNDNDFIMVKKNGGTSDTTFSAAFTPVLLNIGFSVYDLINSRGSWARLNLGFGPIILQRTAPTNGVIGNNYIITYEWVGFISTTGTERIYRFGCNIGNGGTPSAGLIEGSQSNVVFTSTQVQSSTQSHSFVYTANSATAENLFLSVSCEIGTVTLSTTQINVLIQQI